MSNEIETAYVGSTAPYAILRRSVDGFVWQTTTSSFVVPVNANIANYDISLISLGLDLWGGDMPTPIDVGSYIVDFYDYVVVGTPAITDFKLPSGYALYWSGSAVVPPPGPGFVGRYTSETALVQFLGNFNIDVYGDVTDGDGVRDAGAVQQAIQTAEATVDLRTGGPVTFAADAAGTSAAHLWEKWSRYLAATELYFKRLNRDEQTDTALLKFRQEAFDEMRLVLGGLPGVVFPTPPGSGILAAQAGLAPMAVMVPSCCRPAGGQKIYPNGCCL